MRNANIKTIIFQNNVSSSQDGEILNISVRHNTLNVLVETTSTTAVINFEAKTTNEIGWTPINAVNLTTFDVSVTASSNGIYQIDLAGLSKLRCRVSDISDGTIKVTGKVVS